MTDDETIRFYDQQTEAYKKVAKGFSSESLLAFIDHLPTGAQVLDLGCGPGRHARAMQEAGLNVTAMDASAEMVRQVAMIPGVEARQASFSELDDVGAFDAVWASFSLLHAPKEDMPNHLAAIHKALKPGGTFVIELKTGDGEIRDRLNRFYALWQADELHPIMEAAGFQIEGIEHGSSIGMAGTDDPFMSITAHA